MTNTTEEKILSMLSEMQADISGMKTDISGMKADISGMKADIARLDARMETLDAKVESLDAKVDDLAASEEITREGVNTLLEWAENVSRAVRFPLPRLDTQQRA